MAPCSRKAIAHFVRFAAGGGLLFLMSVSLLWGLTTLLQWHYLWATAAVFVAANAAGFWFHRTVTFRTTHAFFSAALFKYYGGMGASLGLNLLSMHLLVAFVGWGVVPASVVTGFWLLAFNFLWHREWTFHEQRPASD